MGEKLTMILNKDQNILYFEKNGEFLGIAFENLPPVSLMLNVLSNNRVSRSNYFLLYAPSMETLRSRWSTLVSLFRANLTTLFASTQLIYIIYN